MVTRQVRQAHIFASGFERGELMKAIAVRAGDWRPHAGQRAAVLVPCFNEGATIGKAVGAFPAALPEAGIYVYDNHSSARTGHAAPPPVPPVRREPPLGKRNAVW